ncbi:hypothetical protein CC80DRAFT_488023 [Byssothecium circinans]|uniref:Uncharacterized protein n=1 Tax=Byssothecium circinans TaxID=147558 RepID=A0A6A5UBR8_9PLEO|nr:hypothetical protein CC80DRAFT_488023 [Byssothecium circinans]
MPSFDRGGFIVVPPTQLKRLYGLPENKLDSFSSQLTAPSNPNTPSRIWTFCTTPFMLRS